MYCSKFCYVNVSWMRDVACFVGVASHFLYSEKCEPKVVFSVA